MHSSSGDPLTAIGVSITVPSADGSRRKPTEPVSTCTSGIDTHVVLPCWQTVTVVKSPLTMPPLGPLGPNPAVTVAVLLTTVEAAGPLELLPQPVRKPENRAATESHKACD